MRAISPSDRIQIIEAHVKRARYLDGQAATDFAVRTYLDEQAGYTIQPNDALRLAERAAGVEPLEQRV